MQMLGNFGKKRDLYFLLPLPVLKNVPVPLLLSEGHKFNQINSFPNILLLHCEFQLSMFSSFILRGSLLSKVSKFSKV